MSEETHINAEVQWLLIKEIEYLLKEKLGAVHDSSPHFADAQELRSKLDSDENCIIKGADPLMRQSCIIKESDPLMRQVSPISFTIEEATDEKPKAKRGQEKAVFLIDNNNKDSYVDALAYLINIYYKPQLKKMQIDEKTSLNPSIFFAMVYTASIEFGYAHIFSKVLAFFELFNEAREKSLYQKDVLKLGYEAVNTQLRNITSLMDPYRYIEKQPIYLISSDDIHRDNKKESMRKLTEFRQYYNIVKMAMKKHPLFDKNDDQ